MSPTKKLVFVLSLLLSLFSSTSSFSKCEGEKLLVDFNLNKTYEKALKNIGNETSFVEGEYILVQDKVAKPFSMTYDKGIIIVEKDGDIFFQGNSSKYITEGFEYDYYANDSFRDGFADILVDYFVLDDFFLPDCTFDKIFN